MENYKKDTFIRLRAVEGKSIETISEELKVETNVLRDWDKKYSMEIIKEKAHQFDLHAEHHNLDLVNRFKHLCEMYSKLKVELDKRDFSGLPTDKLYFIMNDVYDLINKFRQEVEEE